MGGGCRWIGLSTPTTWRRSRGTQTRRSWGHCLRFSGELWVDNDTTWVLKRRRPTSGRARLGYERPAIAKTGRDFNGLHFNENRSPEGIWADGSDMFVSDSVGRQGLRILEECQMAQCPPGLPVESAAGQVSWRQRRRWRDLVEWDHDLGCGLCARQALRIRPSSPCCRGARWGC